MLIILVVFALGLRFVSGLSYKAVFITTAVLWLAMNVIHIISPAEPFYDTAMRHLNNGELEAAESKLDAALQQARHLRDEYGAYGRDDHHMGEIYSAYCWIYTERKNYVKAENACKEAVKYYEMSSSDSTLAKALEDTAGTLILQEKFEEAEPYIVKAVRQYRSLNNAPPERLKELREWYMILTNRLHPGKSDRQIQESFDKL